VRYPNYTPLIQSDYDYITTIDTQILFNAVNIFLKSSLLNNQTNQLFIKVDGLKDFLDNDFVAGFNAEFLKNTLSSWLMMGQKSLSIYNQDKNVNRQFLFVPSGITLYEKFAVQKQLLESAFTILMPVMKSFDGQDKSFVHIKETGNISLTYLDSKPFIIDEHKSSIEPIKNKTNTQNLIDDLAELLEFSNTNEKNKIKELIEDLKQLQSFE
jgi:hypothetical protein